MQVEIKITNWADDSRVDFILSSEHAKSGFKVFTGKTAKQMRHMMVMITETFYDIATIDFLPTDDKTALKEPAEKDIA